jgi:hypothetical protein
VNQYEEDFGKPFFKELSKQLEINKQKEAMKLKRQEEIIRLEKEKKLKLQKLKDEMEKRTRDILNNANFVNLIPKEIIPTLQFYMGMI